MLRFSRAPPVVGLALALAAGASLSHLGVPLLWTLLALPLLLLPIPPFSRPELPFYPLILALLAGGLLTESWRDVVSRDCRFHLAEGQRLSVPGRMVGPVVEGRGEFQATRTPGSGCYGRFRVIFPSRVRSAPGGGKAPIGAEGARVRVGGGLDDRSGVRPGPALTLHGAWRRSGGARSGAPLWAGYLLVDSVAKGFHPRPGSVVAPGWSYRFSYLARGRELLVRVGGAVQSRLRRLFPETAGMATALVWARKEGLDPGTRDAFARAGVAHLLAISGFHVGVVAGLLLLGLGFLGLPHPARFLLAAACVWLYVLAIGAPDAALRAALLFSALALGRLFNRAVAPLGALASVFAIFLFLDPGAWIRPGFQLSFAGTLGLILGYRPVRQWLGGRVPPWVPGFLIQGLAAGVAATLATLPLVAWHFGRISLVGIPVTLLAAPLVALAIPGILASLLGSLAHPALGVFLARGVEAILHAFTAVVALAARLPFASVWVARPTVLAATLALLLAWVALRMRPKLRALGRPMVLTWFLVSGVLIGPMVIHLSTRGQLELVVLDVGQGDALLLRSPGGRWVLVDAGPRGDRFDAGARTVLPYLRKRGAKRLDLLVLTHPDMDHVGGAPAILRDFPVRVVADPGAAVGKGPFLKALTAARDRRVPWRVLRSGDSLNVDGVALRVVAPDGEDESSWGEDANAASIVLELRFGGFAALLTGDAPDSSERRLVSRLLSPRFQILKVGHHGSSTSTSRALLDRADPEVALISVGRRNRFGHPAPGVLGRLSARGTRILRTDIHGTLVVKARRDGSYRFRTSNPPPPGPQDR